MPSSLAKVYLVTYNLLQLFGWATTLTEIIRCAMTREDLWTVTSPGLKIFQTLAILEIAHTALGLVKSNTVFTALQVFSRLFVLWPVLVYSPEARQSYGFPMLLTCWTFAEIIRYGFYLANLLKIEYYPLIWLRYTMFIVLYPLGVTGELLATYAALPKINKEKPLSTGDLNWACYAVIFVMLTYIPVFPKLYGHMLSQRKKALGGKVPAGRKLKK